MAGLFRMDPETGARSVFAIGLDQANGVARGPDGSFYASNDIGGGIGRVLPDGTVQTPWADVESPNGLAIDSLGRTHIVWTDMRRIVTVAQLGLTGTDEDAEYAQR